MDEQETPQNETEVVNNYTVACAVIDVTGYIGEPSRFYRLGGALIKAGLTPTTVKAIFGEGGAFWTQTWEGRAGDVLDERLIRKYAGILLHGAPVVRAAAQPKSADALAEYMQRTGATLGRTDNG